jgi:SAM-dependent methyltransferase
MTRVTGLWVYQTLDPRLPDPDTVARHAHRHGLRWVTAQAVEGDEVLDRDWLRRMRRATRERGMRLGVHGFIGRPRPRPHAEAKAMATAVAVADADFAIVNAEIQYERSPGPDSRRFVEAFRARKPELVAYFSSFGRPQFHAGLDWKAWADGEFIGMPQAYENLNPTLLKPSQCVDDWARFFARDELRPTLGCFSESGHGHLTMSRLAQSVRDVPRLRFNVYRHGTATDAELDALTAL